MKNLILLVGPQGSGKTTYCTQKLPNYTRISQDDHGKTAHIEVFEKAIERGDENIVIDRTNMDRAQRLRYLRPAQRAGYYTKIIWLNADQQVCLKRCRDRKNHPTLDPKDAEGAIANFFKFFKIPSKREADEVVIIGNSYFVPVKDITAEVGDRRHIIVGDIHGCLDELQELLGNLNFDSKEDVLISVGDLVDRGPKVREVLEYVISLPRFYSVRGNHDDKCSRYFSGQKVKLTNGLATTIESFGEKGMPSETLKFLKELPCILKTPSGYVVHAGFNPEMTPEEQSRSDCIYMRYYGGASYMDKNAGVLWYTIWPKDAPRVFYGHIPDPSGPCLSNIVSLDGGCVFGDYMKAFDSRDGIVHYVSAKQQYAVNLHDESIASPHLQITEREQYAAIGLLRRDLSDDKKLAIYTYTDQCTFDRSWDEITRNSRGHIYNVETGERVACAMPKFFNLNENDESRMDVLPWAEGYDVYEKLDGWFSTCFRYEGKFHIASRGSFHSDGAKWATDFIQKKDLSCLPDEATLCFEIITPEQRIILDYKGQSTLIILCGFDRHTGEEYPRCLIEEWGQKIGIPVVEKLNLTVEDCLRLKTEGTDREGFVIRFKKTGQRVKVKLDWYTQLAKIMGDLSPITAWEALENGKIRHEFMVKVAEELRPIAEGYVNVLERQYSIVKEQLETLAIPYANKMGQDRDGKKTVALEMKAAEVPLRIQKIAFALASGKASGLDKLIKNEIYPKNNEFVILAK